MYPFIIVFEIMDETNINQSETILKYIEMQEKSFRLHKLMKKIKKDANKIKVKGDSSALIREDRESR